MIIKMGICNNDGCGRWCFKSGYGNVVIIVLVLTMFLSQQSVYSGQFDCEMINQRQCLCAKGDNIDWEIACPAKFLGVHPLITLKLMISPYDQEKASLRVLCDPDIKDFKFQMVDGLDFSHDNITFDVTSLEISYCPIKSTQELKTFFGHVKLDYLDITSFTYLSWGEKIAQLPSDFLTFMSNLKVIDLRNNELKVLPSFTGLEYLTTLNMRGNHISSIPRDTFKTNKNLQEVRFAGNRLSKNEDNAFPSSLRLLELVNNQIISLSNGSFANLDQLERLYLNNNPLQRLEPGAFNGLNSLKELSLDSSKLVTLPVLKKLQNLQNLSISYSLFSSTNLVNKTENSSYNGIMTTETDMSKKNPNSYSGTTTPHDDQIVFEEGSRTTTTDFERDRQHLLDDDDPSEANENSQNYNPNAHNKDSSDEELIGDLMGLKKLVMINDGLKTFSWLGYLPNLTELNLRSNQIKLIPSGFFSNLPSIVNVDMSKNAITDLSDLNAPQLAYLDLSENFLRYIDRLHLRQLKNLKILLMKSNKINYIHPKAFENLTELMVLDLSNNHISFNQGQSPPIAGTSGFFSSTPGFMHDTGSMDEFGTLFQNCRLERLNLRNNLIHKFFTEWTFTLPYINIFDLSRNKIQKITARHLNFISRNVRVDLRYNEITQVDMDTATVILEPTENRHVAMMLDGNPIHCDCHALAIKKHQMPSYILQYTDLRCHTPPNFHGMRFRDVSENELTCTIVDNCPRGCNCVEIRSENLIKINCFSIEFIWEFGTSLRNFTESHDSYDFEVNLSGKQLQTLNESLIQEISQQVRYVNLTGNKLTTLDFLDSVPEINNVTKFFLANNPLICDRCKFQTISRNHYQRISDLRSVTCVPGSGREGSRKGGGGSQEDNKLLSFYELTKNPVCVEELISYEIKLLIILIGILTPLVILAIACYTKQQKKKRKSNSRKGIMRQKSKAVTDLAAESRTFKPPRSKVVEFDHSKF